MPGGTKRSNRYRIPSVKRILFPEEGEESNLIVDTKSHSFWIRSTMTSSQFHQTMPTQTQEDDNYVEGIDGDFTTRLRYWIDKSPGVSTYNIQLCAIFEAGATINLNDLDKTPKKLKEMALKYEAVVKSIGRDGILLPSEVNKLKVLKHATKNKKKKDTVELDGWPTGQSLWDRYMT